MPSETVLSRLRLFIAAILVAGALGTLVELILLEHYEEPAQLVPLALIVLQLVTLAWNYRSGNRTSRTALFVVMAISVLSGFVGFLAHFEGAAEFQEELHPEIGGWELMLKVLHAKAPPLLAPGMMIQLGLLGLAFVWSAPRSKE